MRTWLVKAMGLSLSLSLIAIGVFGLFNLITRIQTYELLAIVYVVLSAGMVVGFIGGNE